MKNLSTQIRLSLATGYILMFFSEFIFWDKLEGSENPVEYLAILLATWLLYSAEAYMFLSFIRWFRVQSLWAIFLTGAAYGWLLEGIASPTMYADFPINIAMTGLNWHALLDVLVGWYLVRYALQEQTYLKTIGVSVLIGLFWGFWSIGWWVEKNTMVPLGEYALFAFSTSFFLILAYWFSYDNPAVSFSPNKIGLGLLALLNLAVFIGVVTPQILFAPLVLPPLLALIFFALRKNKRHETHPDILASLSGPGPVANYAALLLLPAAAVISYAIYGWLEVHLYTLIIVAVITVILGVGFFVISLFKLMASNPNTFQIGRSNVG